MVLALFQPVVSVELPRVMLPPFEPAPPMEPMVVLKPEMSKVTPGALARAMGAETPKAEVLPDLTVPAATVSGLTPKTLPLTVIGVAEWLAQFCGTARNVGAAIETGPAPAEA